MPRPCKLFLLPTFFTFIVTSAAAEETKVKLYVPSPHAEYNVLSSTGNTFLATSGATNTAVGVGIGTTAPSTSSILDVYSPTDGAAGKGLELPRVADTTATTIAAPVRGMLVYDLSAHAVKYYNGSAWSAVTAGGSGEAWTDVSGRYYAGNPANASTNVGIGTTVPYAKLHVVGAFEAMDYGGAGSGPTAPVTGAGTRLIFSHQSLYAGRVTGTLWDYRQEHCVAIGEDASCSTSASAPTDATAYGEAIGYRARAGHPLYNTAIGYSVAAGGPTSNIYSGRSVAIGHEQGSASGNSSLVLGRGSISTAGTGAMVFAPGATVGTNNTPYTILMKADGGAYLYMTSTGVGINTTSVINPLTVSGTLKAQWFIELSDMRMKTNISPIEDVLPKLSRLRPVSYQWNEKAEKLGVSADGRREVGLIAQDVKKEFPELAGDFQGYGTVNYGQLSAVLIQAIKELDLKNSQLEHMIQTLEAKKKDLR